jgi:hypothetical protein
VSETTESSVFGDRFRGVPVVGGLLTGLLSFVLGYLSFLGIAAGTGNGIDFTARSLRQVGLFFYNSFLVPTHGRTVEILENDPEGGDVVVQENIREVWYNPFRNSGEIETSVRVLLDGQVYDERTATIGKETAESGQFVLPELTFPDFVYLSIPVVVLVGLGALFAYRFISLDGVTERPDLLTRALVGGGTITLGFLLLALVGTYVFVLQDYALFRDKAVEGAFTRPDRLETLLYATAYPLLCGAVGSMLGQILKRPSIIAETSGSTDAERTGVQDSPEPADTETVSDDGATTTPEDNSESDDGSADTG